MHSAERPRKYKHRINLRISNEEMAYLVGVANKERRNLSDAIRFLLFKDAYSVLGTGVEMPPGMLAVPDKIVKEVRYIRNSGWHAFISDDTRFFVPDWTTEWDEARRLCQRHAESHGIKGFEEAWEAMLRKMKRKLNAG